MPKWPFLAAPQPLSQSQAFFRLSLLPVEDIALVLGGPVVLSDCFQALGTLVSNTWMQVFVVEC